MRAGRSRLRPPRSSRAPPPRRWRPLPGICCRPPTSCTDWCRDSGSRADSAARLLLGGFLLRGRFWPGGGAAGGLALERALDVGEDAVTFLRSDQAAADGVADQLFGAVDGELAQSRGPADRLDGRVGHGAAEYTRDAGEGFEQRRNLRPAELSWGGHRTRCSGAEGRAKLHRPLGSVKDFRRNYDCDARLRRWRSAWTSPPGARREIVKSECDNSSPSTLRVLASSGMPKCRSSWYSA